MKIIIEILKSAIFLNNSLIYTYKELASNFKNPILSKLNSIDFFFS